MMSRFPENTNNLSKSGIALLKSSKSIICNGKCWNVSVQINFHISVHFIVSGCPSETAGPERVPVQHGNNSLGATKRSAGSC